VIVEIIVETGEINPGEPGNLIVRSPEATAEAGLQTKVVETIIHTAHPTGEKDSIIPAGLITTVAGHKETRVGTRLMATEPKGMGTVPHATVTRLPDMETELKETETGPRVMGTETLLTETDPNRETITGNTMINQNSGATEQKLPIKNSANPKNLPVK
jgi:hypothetical protein